MGMGMAQLGLRHALARLRGKQLEIARRQEKEQQKLEATQQALARLAADAAATAHEVELLSAALSAAFADPGTSVEPRQTYPKRHLGSWGALTRTILDIFRDANGEALTATEMAHLVQERLGVDLPTPNTQSRYRRQIGKTLNNMKRTGYIEGLHDPAVRKEGVWLLKASSE
jgi:hypothetical protein